MKIVGLIALSISSLFGFDMIGVIHPSVVAGNPAITLLALAAVMPLVGMALTITTTRLKSHSLYRALATVAWDSSYLSGGEVFDVSAIMPNRVFGAVPIASSVNDYTWLSMFVQGSSQSPSTCVIQKYESTTGAPIALVEVPNTTNISAADTELYEIIGD